MQIGPDAEWAGRPAEVEMRNCLVIFALVVCTLLPVSLAAQESLTPANLPDFIAAYDKNFEPIETLYSELINEQLPLRDEQGQPLGRRPLEDRRQALSDLREVADQFARSPQDLVLSARLVLRTESLADDLFDLSQIAYDNDREELARRLADLQTTMDHDREALASYLLDLAGQNQERLKELEKENAELQAKLKTVERK